jgi:hypothetical protein
VPASFSGIRGLSKIEAARAINQDHESSRRIVALKLFGSVLTGPDDGDAGDIDLVVQIDRRGLPEKDLRQVEAVESARAPEGVFARYFHHRTEIRRAIKKVSHRISIHDQSDLDALECPNRTIYRFARSATAN